MRVEAVPEPDSDDIPWPAAEAQPLDAAGLAASRAAAMKRRPTGPVWVFGYGSLIWNPAFVPAERRRAVLHGWRRAFCFWTVSARGTPERPGLGLGLESGPGARCGGVALRIATSTEAADLESLWGAGNVFCRLPAGLGAAASRGNDGKAGPGALHRARLRCRSGHPQYCPPLSEMQQAASSPALRGSSADAATIWRRWWRTSPKPANRTPSSKRCWQG